VTISSSSISTGAIDGSKPRLEQYLCWLDLIKELAVFAECQNFFIPKPQTDKAPACLR
jgi:hypothetical protein